MNDLSLKTILENAAAWPEEDRRELAEFARVIEARRKGFYETDESERRALAEGLGDAENGRFASESMLEASAKRFGA